MCIFIYHVHISLAIYMYIYFTSTPPPHLPLASSIELTLGGLFNVAWWNMMKYDEIWWKIMKYDEICIYCILWWHFFPNIFRTDIQTDIHTEPPTRWVLEEHSLLKKIGGLCFIYVCQCFNASPKMTTMFILKAYLI